MSTRFIHSFLITIFLSLVACDEVNDSKQDDPCRGACVQGTVCQEGQCVSLADMLDQEVSSDSDTSVENDASLADEGLVECIDQRTRLCALDIVGETAQDDELNTQLCPGAFQICESGQWGVCQAPQERCDHLDNDCDGTIDETFDLGVSCEQGIGACLRQGQTICALNGEMTCGASPATPLPELCNGIDDDCDGQSDEDFIDLGQECTRGEGQCLSMGVIQCQSDGTAQCTAESLEPDQELCDLIDNDCDGIIDESDPQVGLACDTAESGICQIGSLQCENGQLFCNRSQDPSSERCDTLDNDCDGSSDEHSPALGTECTTNQLGICSLGRIGCTYEQTWSCSAIFEPVAEICDRLDNDCDGKVDETFPEFQQLCETGEAGLCAQGISTCVAGQVSCQSITEPSAEQCNASDDDCDGIIDEDSIVNPESCDSGLRGVCRLGQEACLEGHVQCQALQEPQAELCDGLDNDCDGLADESFPGLGLACQAGLGECATAGIIGCSSDDQEQVCLAPPIEPQAELCDGLDNDCDGLIDNLIAPPSQPEHCGACGVACAYPNALGLCADLNCLIGQCNAGWVDLDGLSENGCEAVCIPTKDPTEVCDGLDNDCDGQIDSDSCQGDLFRFCDDRQANVNGLVVCDSFSSVMSQTQYWPEYFGTEASGTDQWQAPQLQRSVNAQARYDAQGNHIGTYAGGLTRRMRPIYAGFRFSFYADLYDSELGVMLYKAPIPYEINDIEPELQGYSLTISPVNNLNTYPQIIIKNYAGEILWQADLPDLERGQRAWISWQMNSEGQWEVRFNHRVVLPEFQATNPHLAMTLDRLHLWLGASQVNPEMHEPKASIIEAYSVEVDQDGDDIFLPYDNCPKVYNPDQLDPNQNGQGIACDDRDQDGIENSEDNCIYLYNPQQTDQNQNGIGDLCELDYDLAFNSDRFGRFSTWSLDLYTGLRSAGAIQTMNAELIDRDSDQWKTWAEQGQIWLQDPNGEKHLLDQGDSPFLFDQYLFYWDRNSHRILRRPKSIAELDLNLAPTVIWQETRTILTVQSSHFTNELLVISQTDQARFFSIIDLQGTVIHELDLSTVLPSSQGINVRQHPTQPWYVFSWAEATTETTIDTIAGAYLLKLNHDDPENSEWLNILDQPVYDSIFVSDRLLISLLKESDYQALNPNHTPLLYGDHLVLIAHRIQHDTLEEVPQVLWGPSPWLGGQKLGLISRSNQANELPQIIALDTDQDGVANDLDQCEAEPTITHFITKSFNEIPNEDLRFDLYAQQDGFALNWHYRRGSAGILKLDRFGNIQALRELSADCAHQDDRYTSPMIWTGMGYDLIAYRDLNTEARLERRTMSPNWFLSEPEVILSATENNVFTPGYWSVQNYGDYYTLSTNSVDRHRLKIAPHLNPVLQEQITLPFNAWDCHPHQNISDYSIEPRSEFIQCVQPYGSSINTFRYGISGLQEEAINVDSGIFERNGSFKHQVAKWEDYSISAYIDEEGIIWTKKLDESGRPISLRHQVSHGLGIAKRITLAAGPKHFGLLVIAEQIEGTDGLYFIALRHDATQASQALRITPRDIGISKNANNGYNMSTPKLVWDRDTWIMIWGDDRKGLQFAQGRFDCP